MSTEKRRLIDDNGIRLDGRKADELRPTFFKMGVLEKADGSAYVEQGKNKILVAVYGPRELHPRHLALPDKAFVRCRYHMAPFSTDTRKSPAPTRREIELSKVIREALEPTIFTELYPRTAVDIFIEILQSDGGTRCAGISAASLALADAGVPLRDLISACAVGKVDGQVVLDLNDAEDKEGTTDMPVAIMPQTKSIKLLQLDGILMHEEFAAGIDLAIKGCMQIYELQKEAIKQKYSGLKDTENETENETEKQG